LGAIIVEIVEEICFLNGGVTDIGIEMRSPKF
jgi:hypothetical protein